MRESADPSATDAEAGIAWDVIEEVCAARFTGELTLTTIPPTATAGAPASVTVTNVYMTRGLIYFAEHSTGAPIGERLARIGAIPAELLQVVGPDDGRLTDLDALFADLPVSSRERAETEIQAETEKALVQISEHTVVSVESTMYRHHRSGIDRWFSSQHARGGSVSRACESQITIEPGDEIELVAPPETIPPLEAETVSADVADALQRAVSAIESATRTIGPAPKGFVRAPRQTTSSS